MSRGPLHAKGIPGVAHGWATIRTRWPWRVFRERIGIPLACGEPPTGCRGGWRSLNRLSRTSSPGARDRSDRPRSGTSCGVSLSVHFARSPSCAERDTPRGGSLRNPTGRDLTKSPATFSELAWIPAFAGMTEEGFIRRPPSCARAGSSRYGCASARSTSVPTASIAANISPQVAGDGDPSHRKGDLAVLDPEPGRAARIIAGDAVDALPHQLGDEQPAAACRPASVEAVPALRARPRGCGRRRRWPVVSRPSLRAE